MIPAFDKSGGLPPGDHPATLAEISEKLGFTPRRSWLIEGLRKATDAFWAAGIEEIIIDGSFCTDKPTPGDIDGYWVEPDAEVYDRIDPYWIDFEFVRVPNTGKRKWRMWSEFGVEFFIHPAMQATSTTGFPEFFRHDRDGKPRGLIRIMKAEKA